MKLKLLFFGSLLATHASAVVVHYLAFYNGGANSYTSRTGSIRDHKAQGLIDGLYRWSGGEFEAYRLPGGTSVVVKNNNLAPNLEIAGRVLGEMYSLVAHFAADG